MPEPTDAAKDPDPFDPFATRANRRLDYLQRRRAKLAAEMERNRRGDHRVPTWVLVATLVVIIAGCAIVVLTG
jgi:hypothetical protein